MLQSLLPLVAACGTALAFDRLTDRAGLTPPNFRLDLESTAALPRAAVLRSLAMLVLAVVFWVAVFAPLSMLGQGGPIDPAELTVPQLFFLHVVFVVALLIWYLLGFAGSGRPLVGSWVEQFGFRATSIPREIGIGLIAGVAGWLGVIASLLLVALAFYLVGGEEAVPSQPPEMIGWVVALPAAVRALLSLSAGVVEETFFRGLLQPRAGIALSTILFVMAHMSYEQAFLLIGVTLLSILFAWLVRWRQNLWAAITAHTVFDAIQLLIVIPSAMRFLDSAEAGPVALALAWAVGL